MSYGNAIYHPHDGHMSVISSNVFRYLDPVDSTTKDVFIKDDGNGNISFYQKVGQSDQITLQNAGTVDYERGIIRINQVQVLSPTDTPEIRIFAVAKNQRYVSVRDKIIFNDYLNDSSAIQIETNGVKQTTSTGAVTTSTSTATGSASTSSSSSSSSSGY